MATARNIQPEPSSPEAGELAAQRSCPRGCNNRLVQAYVSEPPSCPVCGYEDYDYVLPKHHSVADRLFTKADYLVRYVGKSPALKGKLVYVQVPRGDGKRSKDVVDVRPLCPFCEVAMQYVVFDKYRREKTPRFVCEQGHRISLITDDQGNQGWK